MREITAQNNSYRVWVHNLFHPAATPVFTDASLICQFLPPILCQQQEMASLTNQQRVVWEKILEGHSVALTGQAGTGKTYLLREVVKDLKFIEKKFHSLCSTGIGCMQYYDLVPQLFTGMNLST